MNNISLAAKYRPQNFSTMLGQDTIRKVLSEAAFSQKVAPAYLLSGTRGVGKTTIARIFAKALNCDTASTRVNGEPCNECESCRSITQGRHVDVLEMDGASNRGIEDAKRIREIVQYAPLEGRYKVIIIDEAHMLTKDAFNALLKTLEEPPSHTTFVFATTESHKFPITIISRCQHFVCKPIPELVLRNHLKFVLESEQKSFEDEALQIIAKRGAGSVRDSMSLLDQTLALAADAPVSASLTRTVLGLAEKDILSNLLRAIADNNPLEVAKSVESMTLQGLDIAYFLRELAQLWRSFFLLQKYGNKALDLLELTSDEANNLLEMAKPFSASFVHSAWQMTLEAQRKIVTGLEPAVSLELFLINLALLPELLPIAELKNIDEDEAEKKKLIQTDNINNDSQHLDIIDDTLELSSRLESEQSKEEVISPAKLISSSAEAVKNIASSAEKEKVGVSLEEPSFEPVNEAIEGDSIRFENNEVSEQVIELAETLDSDDKHVQEDEIIEQSGEPNFKDFLAFLKNNKNNDLYIKLNHIRNANFEKSEDSAFDYHIRIDATSLIHAKQLDANACKVMQDLLFEYCGYKVAVEINSKNLPKTPSKLKEELEEKPIIQEIKSLFNAHIVYCEAQKVD